jgi:hypothetical protein
MQDLLTELSPSWGAANCGSRSRTSQHFIIVFTRALSWFSIWARWIKSIYQPILSLLTSILILPTHLCLSLLSGLFFFFWLSHKYSLGKETRRRRPLVSPKRKIRRWILLVQDRNKTRDLPACSIVPQPTTLQRVPLIMQIYVDEIYQWLIYRLYSMNKEEY